MKEEQKEILIAKILDEPEFLSDVELKIIFSDPELKELYEISSSISGAYLSSHEFDKKKEWSLFKKKIRHKSNYFRLFIQVAAIFIGISLAVGVFVYFSSRSIEKETTDSIAEIDIDEYLRIQEASIDNDLAILNASVYEDELKSFLPLLESVGVNEEEFDGMIKMVTMQ